MYLIIVTCFFASTLQSVYSDIGNSNIACSTAQPHVLRTNNGYFTSPNYNSYYPNNANCTWHISSTNKTKVIKLTVWFFNLVGYGEILCTHDSLTLYDSATPNQYFKIGRYCGSDIPDYITTTGPDAYVWFITNEALRSTGFNISFEVIDPPRECEIDDVKCRNGKCVPPNTRCNGHDDCNDGTDEENCGDVIVPPDICGQPVIKPSLHEAENVVGGTTTVPGSWPYVVELRLLTQGGLEREEACGGTLINERYVLTAAHCFKIERDINLWSVRLGAYHKYFPTKGEVIRYIEECIVHPDYIGYQPYNPDNYKNVSKNDIAILKLNAPVTVTDTIQPACLPSSTQKLSVGDFTYVLGWGITEDTGLDTVLRQGAVPIYPLKECDKKYSRTVWNKMICAGYQAGGTDSCKGDSGGPMMMKINGNWTLVGIISFGAGTCGLPDMPGVYTNVPSYVDWINKIIYNITIM